MSLAGLYNGAATGETGAVCLGVDALPPAKTSLAEKLLAFAIAAVYAAIVGYIVVGVTRRAATEVRAQRAELARKKAATPKLAAMPQIAAAMPRVAAALRRLRQQRRLG